MPFLVSDVHGLSGLALANAEPAGEERMHVRVARLSRSFSQTTHISLYLISSDAAHLMNN